MWREEEMAKEIKRNSRAAAATAVVIIRSKAVTATAMVIATAMETATKSERFDKFEKEWCRKERNG